MSECLILLHCVYIQTEMAQFPDRWGGGCLGQFLLGLCDWPLRTPAPL